MLAGRLVHFFSPCQLHFIKKKVVSFGSPFKKALIVASDPPEHVTNGGVDSTPNPCIEKGLHSDMKKDADV